MDAINATLIWVGALVIILGVVAIFMFAYVQAVMLAGMKRQGKITRRDYFAAHAPQHPKPWAPNSGTELFKWRWQYADAMIKAGDR